MKKITGLLFLTVLFSGCAAHMMETHGGSVSLMTLGKGSQQDKGGVIRYLNTGMSAMKKARRADAENQMKKFCVGAYTIAAEGPRSKFGADMPIGKSVSLEVDEYNYIRFECEKAGP